MSVAGAGPAGPDRLLDELRAALGPAAVIADPALMEGYRDDQAALVRGGMPRAVVRPADTEQVRATMRAAQRAAVPVVVRGAGSGLAGGAAAIAGGLVLSTEALDRILEIDVPGMVGRAQAGVINGHFAAAAAAEGLWYPPDPASRAFCTLGGNIATNAGGLCCVKYGVTGDSVLGLTAVLADGSLLEVGGATVKRVAGLDLRSLLVGSEGTLAVVTEATLRLRPRPAPALTGAAYFPTLAAAGEAVVEMGRAGATPSLLEIIDRATLGAVESWRRLDLDLDAAALLLFQSDLPGRACHDELALCGAACERAGATLVVVAEDEADSALLMEVRRLCFPALEHRGATLLEDVSVPRVAVPALLVAIEEIARRCEVEIFTFGHAGDGNMHPTIVFRRDDAEQVRRVERATGRIFKAALALGGTITGEHGVGLLKLPWLEDEVGPVARRLTRGIKATFDPDDLLNPGRAI